MAVAGDIEALRLHDHPGLGAALGPLAVEPLPLRRRSRRGRPPAARCRGCRPVVRALPRRRRAAHRRVRLGDHRLGVRVHRGRVGRAVRALGTGAPRAGRDGRVARRRRPSAAGLRRTHERLSGRLRAAVGSRARALHRLVDPGRRSADGVAARASRRDRRRSGAARTPRTARRGDDPRGRPPPRVLLERRRTVAAPNSETMVGGGYLRRGHPGAVVGRRRPGRASATVLPVRRARRARRRGARRSHLARSCSTGHWALERCPTSLTETWYGGTVSHGWSSTPTRDLVQRVLGVIAGRAGLHGRARRAGARSPRVGHGRVPTLRGTLEVEVALDHAIVDSPVPIVHGDQRLPAGRHRIDLRSTP